jgi:hypothetical protein
LVKVVGHESNLMRSCFQYEVNKFLLCTIPFNVKLSGDDLPDLFYIMIPDMALIGPGMNSYTVRSETLRVDGSLYHVRIITTPRITKSRKLVDINR